MNEDIQKLEQEIQMLQFLIKEKKSKIKQIKNKDTPSLATKMLRPFAVAYENKMRAHQKAQEESITELFCNAEEWLDEVSGDITENTSLSDWVDEGVGLALELDLCEDANEKLCEEVYKELERLRCLNGDTNQVEQIVAQN